jgi:hypothetical protein
MARHSIYDGQENNRLSAFIITMMNPSDVLPTMVPFDNDKETIVACWIGVLWSDPLWEKDFPRLVEVVSDNELFFY